MSDFWQGPGWWQSGDGKWHPPGAHADASADAVRYYTDRPAARPDAPPAARRGYVTEVAFPGGAAHGAVSGTAGPSGANGTTPPNGGQAGARGRYARPSSVAAATRTAPSRRPALWQPVPVGVIVALAVLAGSTALPAYRLSVSASGPAIPGRQFLLSLAVTWFDLGGWWKVAAVCIIAGALVGVLLVLSDASNARPVAAGIGAAALVPLLYGLLRSHAFSGVTASAQAANGSALATSTAGFSPAAGTLLALAACALLIAGPSLWHWANSQPSRTISPLAGGRELRMVGTGLGVPAAVPASGAAPPVPGWYPDPSGPGWLRWWDGSSWTGHTHQAS